MSIEDDTATPSVALTDGQAVGAALDRVAPLTGYVLIAQRGHGDPGREPDLAVIYPPDQNPAATYAMLTDARAELGCGHGRCG